MNVQPERKTFFGACPHDCPDTCAMIYEVQDSRLVEVRGNKDHPMTRGGLCVKLKDFHDHHANPERLMYPLRRIGRPEEVEQFVHDRHRVGEGRRSQRLGEAGLARVADGQADSHNESHWRESNLLRQLRHDQR